MITTVIFDLGGVLLRTEDRSPRTKLAQRLGMTYEELESQVYGSREAMKGEISAETHKRTFLKELGLPEDAMEEFGDEFWGGDRLDTVLVDFVRNLRGAYTTALLSNAWDDLRPLLINRWKIADAFDQIFISAEMGLAKPDPTIYQAVTAELKVDPAELVFVDDFIENVDAAREEGWNAVHFRSREGALVELAEYLDSEHSLSRGN
jgi:putative hydrolase of the HAD superfamily